MAQTYDNDVTRKNSRRRAFRRALWLATAVGVFYVGRFTAATRNGHPKDDNSIPAVNERVPAAVLRARTKLGSRPYFSDTVIAHKSDGCFTHENGARSIMMNFLSDLNAVRERDSPDESLQSYVAKISPFMRVFALVIKGLGPEAISSVNTAYEEELCDHSASEKQLMGLALLGNIMPDVVSRDALKCFFSTHNNEDILLRSMITNWRSIGRPSLPEVDALRAVAKDEGIRRQFMSPEEERATRSPETH